MTINDMDLLLAMSSSLRETGQTTIYGLVWRYVRDDCDAYLLAEAGGVVVMARPFLRRGYWTYSAAGGDPFRRLAGKAPSLRHGLRAVARMFPEIAPSLQGVLVDRVWIGGRGYVLVRDEGLNDANDAQSA